MRKRYFAVILVTCLALTGSMCNFISYADEEVAIDNSVDKEEVSGDRELAGGNEIGETDNKDSENKTENSKPESSETSGESGKDKVKNNETEASKETEENVDKGTEESKEKSDSIEDENSSIKSDCFESEAKEKVDQPVNDKNDNTESGEAPEAKGSLLENKTAEESTSIRIRVSTNSNAEVIENVEPDIFSISVPVVIGIDIDMNGNISISNDLKIINGNDAAIKCTSIDFQLAPGWNAVDFDRLSEIGASEKLRDTNSFSIAFRGDKLNSSGNIKVSPSNWNIAANEELPLNVKARVSKFSDYYEGDVAEVNWVFDWSTKSETSNPDIGNDIEDRVQECSVTIVLPECAEMDAEKVVVVAKDGYMELPEIRVDESLYELGNWINSDTLEILEVSDNKIKVTEDIEISIEIINKEIKDSSIENQK